MALRRPGAVHCGRLPATTNSPPASSPPWPSPSGSDRGSAPVSLYDPGFGYCGSGGCAGYAILATAQDYAPKTIELAYFFAKAIILPTVHHGMHDLRYDGARKIFQWDGTAYTISICFCRYSERLSPEDLRP